jgi:hypothetical protein
MQNLSHLLVCVFSIACLSHARAANDVKTEAKAAKKACATGDFRKGAEILAGLYVDTDDPTYIYNQGRCYEQNHQWTSAIDRFREYLRNSKGLSATDKAEVEKHIADCESFLDKQEPRSAPPPLAFPPVVASVAPAPPPPAPATITVLAPAPHEDRHGSGLRVAGFVLGSIGVAALAAGLALNLEANSLAREVNRTHDLSTQSSQSSYKTSSMICYASGAGSVLAGVLLYLIGRQSADTKATQMAVLPILAREEISLAIQGTFP